MAEPIATAVWPTPAQRLRLEHHLRDFSAAVAGVRAAVVASVDGFALAGIGEAGAGRGGERLAAMTSSMLGLAGAIGRELALGELEVLMADASDGKVLMLAVPCRRQPLLLMAACSKRSVIGNALWSAKECGRKIQAELGGP